MTQYTAYEKTAAEQFLESIDAPAQELLKKFLAEHPEYTGHCYRIEGKNAHLRVRIWRGDEKKLSDKEIELIASYVTIIYNLFPAESRSYFRVPLDEDQVLYLLRPSAP